MTSIQISMALISRRTAQNLIGSLIRAVLLCLCVFAFSGCQTYSKRDPDGLVNVVPTSEKDGAPESAADVSGIADAVPKYEPRTRAGNQSPYKVSGKVYRVIDDARGYQQTGIASWYGRKFHGKKTANGEIYNMFAMTAAHKTLPIPSYVRVDNLANGKSIVVKVNDRGPFAHNRIIDLSYAGASKLGFIDAGTAQVRVTYIAVEKPLGTKVEEFDIAQATGLYLQLGAFSERQTASAMKIRAAKHSAKPVFIEAGSASGGGRLHRVFAGPFANERKLQQQREAFIKSGLPAALRVLK